MTTLNTEKASDASRDFSAPLRFGRNDILPFLRFKRLRSGRNDIFPFLRFNPLRSDRNEKYPFFILCAVAGSLSLTGCNTVPGQINSAIAAKLPSALGPADRYSVTSDGSIFELLRGKLRSCHVHGDNVCLSPMLRVSSFDADATDIHANTRTDALTSIGKVTFQASMDQSDLDSYMLAAQPDNVAHGAKITLDGKRITYSDNVGIFSIRTPFSVTGVLVPHPGNHSQIDFIASKASLAHLAIPKSLVTLVVNHDNPVVDLTAMKYPVTITSTCVNDSVLTISGSVDLSSLIGTVPGGTT